MIDTLLLSFELATVWVAVCAAAFTLHILMGVHSVGAAEVSRQLERFHHEVGTTGIALHIVSAGLIHGDFDD